MNQQFRFGHFNILPPVVKNLLIINGLFFLGTIVVEGQFGLPVLQLLGLPYWKSPYFEPYQLITHMFIHGSEGHIFSNMFVLWMFGTVIENYWGGKRFLVYYFITGLGAAVLHNFAKSIDILLVTKDLSADEVKLIFNEGFHLLEQGRNYVDDALGKANIQVYQIVNSYSLGASGAVYGVLMAFGLMFPNSYIYLFFLIPIKARHLVIGFIIMELVLAIANNPNDPIAHIAHLGGMLFGYLLIKYWNKTNRNNLY